MIMMMNDEDEDHDHDDGGDDDHDDDTIQYKWISQNCMGFCDFSDFVFWQF